MMREREERERSYKKFVEAPVLVKLLDFFYIT